MSCHLPRMQRPLGRMTACDVGGHTSWAPWNWDGAPVFGAASFSTLPMDLVTPRTHFCGLPASMGCTVQTVCNATPFLATFPAFCLWGCFLFSQRRNSPNIKFTLYSCPIHRRLVHSHVAQPPPLLSFETLSTSSKTTLHLPGSHSPASPSPRTPHSAFCLYGFPLLDIS